MTRARLKRSDTQRSLVAQSASLARVELRRIAKVPRSEYRWRDAVVYGSFIDIAISFGLPIGGPLSRIIIQHGGPENVRFLLTLSEFDADGSGHIDDDEYRRYEKLSDLLISDSVTMCGNLALVGALLLGLTHLTTIGRPVPLGLSAASAAEFVVTGQALVWIAYGFNLLAEALAFFTLAAAIITRNLITNVLPTRALKTDMLRTSSALGTMSVGMLLTLWCFLLSCVTLPLVALPVHGWLASAIFLMLMLACMCTIAPWRYTAALLLHEEIKRFINENDSSVETSFAVKQRTSVLESRLAALDVAQPHSAHAAHSTHATHSVLSRASTDPRTTPSAMRNAAEQPHTCAPIDACCAV